MKNYALILSLLLAMVLNTSCRTSRMQAAKGYLPNLEQPPEKPIFPVYEKAVLQNGLTLIAVSDSQLPIAEVMLVFRKGTTTDPRGKAGLFSLSLDMLKEGAGPYSSLALAEQFANLGTDATTEAFKEIGTISAAIMSNYLEQTLELFGLMVTKPLLKAEDFSRVKQVLLGTIEAQKGIPQVVAKLQFLKYAYGPNHPYGYSSEGDKKSASSISLEDVRKTVHTWFVPNDAALVVVGDVTLANLQALAQKTLGHWKGHKTPEVSLPALPTTKERQTILVSRPSSPQTVLVMGTPAMNPNDEQVAATDVFLKLLAGAPTSRLDANLREKKGWTYGVTAQANPMRQKGPFWIQTNIQTPYTADGISEILSEFHTLSTEKVSQDELQKSKNVLLFSFAHRYSTLGKIANRAAFLFAHRLPDSYDQTLYQSIERVSADDILQVARRLLDPRNLTVVAVGDLAVIEKPIRLQKDQTVVIESLEGEPKSR